MTSPEEARAALDAKAAAERYLAAAADCPPWRHAAFGLIMGALVATPAFDLPLRGAILALAFAGTALIVAADRRRTGMFVNGYRPGRTRIVAFAMLAVELALFALSARLGMAEGDRTAVLGIGLLAFLVGVLGSVIWQRVYLRELGR